MINIFPAPKRYIGGFAKKSVSVSALVERCPVSFGARLLHPSLLYRHDATLPDQGFRLRFRQSMLTVEYSDLHGLRYAHLAINQLIDDASVVREDAVIEDHPDFPVRSVLLDISRDRVPTIATLKRLIDYFSSLRFNQLQLYTEHTFAYVNHETVWRDYSPMTAEDTREIDAYCCQLGIELVANQACFGHMEKWLCHPEYAHLAEQTEGFRDQRGDFRAGAFGLNPISDQTTAFIDGLIEELAPNFSSNTLNVNFDETMDLGMGASKSACEIYGKGRVFLNYLNKVIDIAASKGKQCQIFSDMLFRYPNLICELPKGLTLLNWGYEPDHPFDAEHKQLAQFGYPFHVVVSTNCFASVAGRWHDATTHMRRAAKSAKHYGAEGFMVTEWGDMGHGQQHAMPIPAYAFGAAMAWGQEQQVNDNVDLPLRWYYPDATETEFGALLALQNFYRQTGVTTPNCAFFGPVLFDQASRRHIKRATWRDIQSVENARKKLAKVKASLSPAKGGELSSELLWTAEALDIACRIVMGYIEEGHREVERFSAQRKKSIRRDVAVLLETYRTLWRENYREGGLKQSSARLEFLQSLLQEEQTTALETEAVM
ncbi:beta-N-acetylhexosaminidase [Enterovibrio paralichthyis]|uniref:beta-N-acetylhexosaminidase n=1 Tax=Enterovibrio paralichthyis TaxID=2853805 RepID=UPI001C457F47|nr:beta-N-acetylhexosaminidase [Enterovibrio paralichthyis]MBV7298107.1 beta-N-acetylhexosaminidase [Enterovibrio paralichthyis]